MSKEFTVRFGNPYHRLSPNLILLVTLISIAVIATHGPFDSWWSWAVFFLVFMPATHSIDVRLDKQWRLDKIARTTLKRIEQSSNKSA